MTGDRRVWVTRAEPGASRTAERLREIGWSPVVRPLLKIRPLSPDVPDLEGVSAIAFTSRNGVSAFAELTLRRDRRVFTVGEATAQAAREAGFADVRSADGAIGDLVALIAREMHPEEQLLAAVAREPVADLQALLAGRVQVETLAVYEAVETGTAAPDGLAAILIHSPRAAVALATLGAQAVERRRVVAISAQAAAPLNGLPVADLHIARHPSEAGMLEALGKPAPGV
ncbi:uroporphyrinogen-III synthase [Brevundimonas sp.]